jgi:excisionase family DNA binding protein
MFIATTEAIPPTDQDSRIACVSSEALAAYLDEGEPGEAQIRLNTGSIQEADLRLPKAAVHLLYQALQEMAKGNAVALLAVDQELTVRQAAELLRMPRPSLVKLLDENKLPSRKVGAHRRVRYQDVLKYLREERARRSEVMRELVAETEKLGLY